MTKADLIDRLAAGTGLTKIETEAVVNGMIALVIQSLVDGESVDLRGFGSFRVQHRAPRLARNPRTNEEVGVDERFAPVFRPSRELREAVDRAAKEAQGRTS